MAMKKKKKEERKTERRKISLHFGMENKKAEDYTLERREKKWRTLAMEK